MCFRPPTVGKKEIKCPKCGAVNLPTAKKCVQCGAEESVVAPNAPPKRVAPPLPKAPPPRPVPKAPPGPPGPDNEPDEET